MSNSCLNKVVYDCYDKVSAIQQAISNEKYYQEIAHILNQVTPPPSYRRSNGSLLPQVDTELIFESRFECGNLRRAIQIYPNEYDLILNYDVNTKGHTQWFYFSVKNMRKETYKFNILNLLKADSLYNYGMKPLMYSEKSARQNGVGWVRCGTNICYYQNNVKRRNGCFYTLSWTHTFQGMMFIICNHVD